MKVAKLTREILRRGVKHLAKKDNDIKMFISKYGLPHLRLRAANFESLVQIICSQQVSTVVASTIFKRIQKLEKQLSPEFISGLSVETLRDTGLSYSKVGYIKGIAGEIVSGKFNLRGLSYLSDEEVVLEMSKQKGIGRWTSQMYLIFALGRPDIWPINDLGVVKGIIGLKKLEEFKTGSKEISNLGDIYRPWRSIAARVFWQYQNISKVVSKVEPQLSNSVRD